MELEVVELIMRVEEEFEIEIPDDDAQYLTTIGAIADYVARRQCLSPDDLETHWERVRALVADELNISPNLVRRDSRIVEDLNLG